MITALIPEDREATMIHEEIISLRRQVADEYGARFASGLNIHLGDIDEEYVPELKTLHSRSRILERMANDPHVRGQLRAILMTLVSGVRWKVEGGTQEQRELVASNLLGQGDPKFWCAKSWLDFLIESMGMLIYGFSAFAKTRSVVDGKIIFSDLTWLHPRSIDEDGWVMDDTDKLIEVRRSYTAPSGESISREPIPVDDLFLMTWDRRGPNWEGNAFIRPMYRPWKLGEIAEKIDIIDLQNRGVGIPIAYLSGAGGTKERDTLINVLKSIRGGSKERAFIVAEKDEKFEFLTSQGQAKDAQPTLQHHRMNITKTAGTEYFEQGNTATGSRAGASALATGFFVNIDGIKLCFEDMVNRGISRMRGLSQELQDMNFARVKEYSRIVGSKVSPSEQLDNIPMIQDGIQKGAIPPHMKLANEMLRRLGWPEFSEEEWEEAMESKRSVFPGVGGPGRPDGVGEDEHGRDDDDSRRMRLPSQTKMKEKKTPIGGSQQSSRPASWRWLRSTTG